MPSFVLLDQNTTIISSYIHTLSWHQRVVGFSRNWENLTVIQTHQLIKSDTLS